MNFIHIAGHLGADPETRFTSTGKKVTTFRVAVRTRKAGKDDTIWWRVTLWGDQFDKLIPYLKKGSAVMIFGEVQKPEIYTDREGKPQASLDITASSIQFSPFGKSDKEAGAASPYGVTQENAPVNPYAMKNSPPAGAPHGETFDDEVPF